MAEKFIVLNVIVNRKTSRGLNKYIIFTNQIQSYKWWYTFQRFIVTFYHRIKCFICIDSDVQRKGLLAIILCIKAHT